MTEQSYSCGHVACKQPSIDEFNPLTEELTKALLASIAYWKQRGFRYWLDRGHERLRVPRRRFERILAIATHRGLVQFEAVGVGVVIHLTDAGMEYL